MILKISRDCSLLAYLVAYLGLCGEYGSVDLGRDDDDRRRHLTIRLVLKVSVNRWAPQLKKSKLGHR
jgi:hypothetical protein